MLPAGNGPKGTRLSATSLVLGRSVPGCTPRKNARASCCPKLLMMFAQHGGGPLTCTCLLSMGGRPHFCIVAIPSCSGQTFGLLALAQRQLFFFFGMWALPSPRIACGSVRGVQGLACFGTSISHLRSSTNFVSSSRIIICNSQLISQAG